MKRYLWGGLGVALVLVGVLAAGRGGAKRAPHVATDSTNALVLGAGDVTRAARADLVAGVPVSGTLQPALDVRIASPIPEIIEMVYVKEGQAVHQGQALARFRTDAAEPAALSAQAAVQLDSTDYVRMQNLYKEGAVSERDVQSAEVVLRAAQATAAQANKKVSESTVRAPANGVITLKAVESGARVKDGDQLFQLANISELEFEATVPSQFAPQVRVGDAVTLRVTGGSNILVRGRIARVNATVDPATRQVKIYVTVPNRDRKLVGGLYASGQIVLRQVRGVIAVPQLAVRSDSTGVSYLLVVANGHIARRDVTTGTVDNQTGLIEITKGLTGGEEVVAASIQGLAVGDAVTLAGGER